MADYSDARHGRSEYEPGEANIAMKVKDRAVDSETIGFQTSRIAELVQSQDMLLAALEDKLDPLLARELDGDGEKFPGEADSPMRRLSPLAEQLEMYADRLERHARRINRITNRVNL